MVYEMQGSYVLGVQSQVPYYITEEQVTGPTNTLINIASDGVSTSIVTNRTLIALGYLAAAIGILTARPFFQEYLVTESTKQKGR
jgi:hypothetical protein